MNLIQRFKAWRERRYWERRHLEFIRTTVMQDWRWLAGDPVARAITDRYEKVTSHDWYKLEHESPDAFRRRIGLDPHRETPNG